MGETQLLRRIREGDLGAESRLLHVVYHDPKRTATACLRDAKRRGTPCSRPTW